MNKYYRHSKYLVCLTSDADNEKMWNEYAESFKGFVLEYDAKEILSAVNNYIIDFYSQTSFSYKDQDILRQALIENDLGVSKVSYSNEPIDISDDFIFFTQNINEINSKDPTEIDVIRNLKLNEKIVSTKRENYSFENEIRLVLPSGYNLHTNEVTQYYIPLFVLKPKAIVIGKCMNEANRDKVINIASQNSIQIIEAS